MYLYFNHRENISSAQRFICLLYARRPPNSIRLHKSCFESAPSPSLSPLQLRADMGLTWPHPSPPQLRYINMTRSSAKSTGSTQAVTC